MAEIFRRHFDLAPRAVSFAPGRVNLIGEHTDYNDGLVLPMAIQYGVTAAASVVDDGEVHAVSENFPTQPAAFRLGDPPNGQTWGDFLKAVLVELDNAGVRPPGLRLAFAGDVPAEAGLSSSAAFAVAAVLVVSALAGKTWPDVVALARLCQAAEHRIGVQCGLLDQMASAAGRAGSAMLLDCRDLTWRMLPIDGNKLVVAVGATGVRRTLAGSKYNERRRECEQGARLCGTASLREVSREQLEQARGKMPEHVYRRCRHVLTENERVRRFATALEAGDYQALGPLADESHASLRDDYEVSCAELDAMVEAFRAEKGVLGARMVGGGFGGSAIALIEPERAEAILAGAAETYRRQTGLTGSFHLVSPGDGASATGLD